MIKGKLLEHDRTHDSRTTNSWNLESSLVASQLVTCDIDTLTLTVSQTVRVSVSVSVASPWSDASNECQLLPDSQMTTACSTAPWRRLRVAVAVGSGSALLRQCQPPLPLHSHRNCSAFDLT